MNRGEIPFKLPNLFYILIQTVLKQIKHTKKRVYTIYVALLLRTLYKKKEKCRLDIKISGFE